jgi:two-component system, chemotaxis family, chemotaxis protein CheY
MAAPERLRGHGVSDQKQLFLIQPQKILSPQTKSTYVSNGVLLIQGQTVINVLIVDDSKFVANSIQTILEEMDFHVVGLAHDGHQGINSFTQFSTDVTLLDITMPNMDGLECLTRIRELDGNARIVMLSAIQDEQTIQKCIAAGASGFLHKPIRKTSPTDLQRLCEALEYAAGKTA